MLLEKNTTNLSLEQFYLSKQDLLSGGYPCKFQSRLQVLFFYSNIFRL